MAKGVLRQDGVNPAEDTFELEVVQSPILTLGHPKYDMAGIDHKISRIKNWPQGFLQARSTEVGKMMLSRSRTLQC